MRVAKVGLDEEAQDLNNQKEVSVDARVYANGFPKSGTHLLEQMVQTMLYPVRFADVEGQRKGPWAGSFYDHSWTKHWAPTPAIYRRLGFLRDGHYMKGHMGYRQDIETFLWGLGCAVVFIYRDLRDVAVSLTHHIITRGGSHSHPEWYEVLGFDGALTAVIRGLHQYDGVVERWEEYAGWLDVEWVMSIRYEDVLANRREVCGDVIRYIVGHNAQFRGYHATIPEEEFERAVDAMVENSLDTEHSPTFRKGVAGGWREVFRPWHVDEFKKSDANGWLVKLGYEDDEDWQGGANE